MTSFESDTYGGRSFDVAIVGAGPTGAFLANALGKAGLTVALIERETSIYTLPRAVHFDGEVMRALQSVDLAEELAEVARPSSKGMHFVSSTGQTLLIRRGYEGRGPQGWARNYYMHQPHFEEVLRRGLRRYPSVSVLLGHEVTESRQTDTGATVSATDLRTNANVELQARFVVGCDGARSFVRRLIGSESEDLGLHQPWLVVDAIVDPMSERVKALKEYTIQLCDPARPMTLVYVGEKRRRWEIMLMPGDDPATMTEPGNVWRVLRQWITPEDATLERAAVYTFHSVVTRGWRKGPFLLAGDACHQTPPFLGQGMCAGLRDAHNLAWKLKAIVHDGAPARILDTYETERRPHVHAFIQLAVELGAIIQATDPEVARKRDESFRAEEPRMFDFPQPQLGPGIRANGDIPVGQIFLQPLIDDSIPLDDIVGGRFALLTNAATRAGLSDRFRRDLEQAGVKIVDRPSREIDEWLDAHAAIGVILRPDAYVYALAKSADDIRRAVDAIAHTMKPAEQLAR